MLVSVYHSFSSRFQFSISSCNCIRIYLYAAIRSSSLKIKITFCFFPNFISFFFYLFSVFRHLRLSFLICCLFFIILITIMIFFSLHCFLYTRNINLERDTAIMTKLNYRNKNKNHVKEKIIIIIIYEKFYFNICFYLL